MIYLSSATDLFSWSIFKVIKLRLNLIKKNALYFYTTLTVDVMFVGNLYGAGAGVRDRALCPTEVDGRGWGCPAYPLYLSTGDW